MQYIEKLDETITNIDNLPGKIELRDKFKLKYTKTEAEEWIIEN
jgi:hypothetical protein